MSDNLYGSGGIIRIDHIEEALNNAKLEGKLNGVPSQVIPRFVSHFEELIKDPEIKSRVGSQITEKEVDFIIDRMKKDKTDNISDSYLEAIRSVLTDRNFNIE